MDFTFNNTLIKDYFNGSNSDTTLYVPSNELIYLHEHPLIRHSFLVELESMILRTSQVIEDRNIKGIILEQFIEHTKELGRQLPTVNVDNAPQILNSLRKIYRLCKSLLE